VSLIKANRLHPRLVVLPLEKDDPHSRQSECVGGGQPVRAVHHHHRRALHDDRWPAAASFQKPLNMGWADTEAPWGIAGPQFFDGNRGGYERATRVLQAPIPLCDRHRSSKPSSVTPDNRQWVNVYVPPGNNAVQVGNFPSWTVGQVFEAPSLAPATRTRPRWVIHRRPARRDGCHPGSAPADRRTARIGHRGGGSWPPDRRLPTPIPTRPPPGR
jgi:hypothetical protein